MEHYIKIYEKEHRKIKIISGLITILGSIFFFVTAVAILLYKLNIFYIVIPALIFSFGHDYYRKKAIANNLKNINNLMFEDLEIELVLKIYEELLSRKNKKKHSALLVCYLQMLLLAGEFDQFIDVCHKNKKRLRALNMDVELKILREVLYSLEKDPSNHRKLLQEQVRLYEKLKKRNTNQEWLYKFYQVKLQYDLKEYDKVLEMLEEIETVGKYNQLVIESYKQRCLYHLDKEYKKPNETLYPFVTVLRWKSLIESGEEYFSLKSKEMIQLIEQSISHSKKRRIAVVLYWLLWSFLVLWVTDDEDGLQNHEITEEVIESYKSNLAKWNYEALEIHGMIENDDMTSAVILATKLEKEPDVRYVPVYLIATIDPYFDGLLPRMRWDFQMIKYKGETKIYATEGENSTYVAVVAGGPSQISYNDTILEDVIIEKIGDTSYTNESYIHCFIHEGEFDESLLEIYTEEVEKTEEIDSYIKTRITEKFPYGFVLAYRYEGNITDVQAPTRYWLEEKIQDEWQVMETQEDESYWKIFPIEFAEGIEVEQQIDWIWLLGYDLEPGEYRVGKEFSWYNLESNATETQTIYFEFQIE